jgi:anti-sigma B factor antagonist
MTTSDHLEVRTDPATGTAVLVGELSFATVGELGAALRERLTADPQLVLDVSRVSFCDSAGLSGLLGARRRAELAGGGVTLIGTGAALGRVLRLTGVEPLFSYREAGEAPDSGRGEPA